MDESKSKEEIDAILKSLSVPKSGDPEIERFRARAKENGVPEEALRNVEDLDEDGKKKAIILIEEFRSGKMIDPEHYIWDENGKLVPINPRTWKKGMKGPNPLGRPRKKIGLWSRFVQIMEMTDEEVRSLVLDGDLTMADKAALRLAGKVANDGAWPQILEVINREEGKVQEKVKIETPPQPIRFIESPRREGLDEEEADDSEVSDD